MLVESIVFSFFRFFRDEGVQPALGRGSRSPVRNRRKKRKKVTITAFTRKRDKRNKRRKDTIPARPWSIEERGRGGIRAAYCPAKARRPLSKLARGKPRT
jgi:hypothetical protein